MFSGFDASVRSSSQLARAKTPDVSSRFRHACGARQAPIRPCHPVSSDFTGRYTRSVNSRYPTFFSLILYPPVSWNLSPIKRQWTSQSPSPSSERIRQTVTRHFTMPCGNGSKFIKNSLHSSLEGSCRSCSHIDLELSPRLQTEAVRF
jgi:hypothetical protein